MRTCGFRAFLGPLVPAQSTSTSEQGEHWGKKPTCRSLVASVAQGSRAAVGEDDFRKASLRRGLHGKWCRNWPRCCCPGQAVAWGRPLPGAGGAVLVQEGVLVACVTRSLGSPLCSPRALPPTGTSSPLAVSVLSTGGLIQVRLRSSKRENGAFLGVRLTPLRWLFRPLWFTRVHKPQTPGRPSKNTTVLLMMKAIPGTGVGFAGVPVTAGGDSQRPALASAAGFPLTPRQCHPWHPVCAPDTLREQGPVRTDGRPGGGPSE